MTVFVISDLHLGHKNICRWSPKRRGPDVEAHDAWIIEQWNSVVKKRDVVWVLGDVAFSHEGLAKVPLLNGMKYLITGNHDKYRAEAYQEHFKLKPGICRLKGMWLSHAPIHPSELRGRLNIHGHSHDSHMLFHGSTERDYGYYNVCVEACEGKPVDIAVLIEHKLKHKLEGFYD